MDSAAAAAFRCSADFEAEEKAAFVRNTKAASLAIFRGFLRVGEKPEAVVGGIHHQFAVRKELCCTLCGGGSEPAKSRIRADFGLPHGQSFQNSFDEPRVGMPDLKPDGRGFANLSKSAYADGA